jgi:membrane protein involved in colicin uptake
MAALLPGKKKRPAPTTPDSKPKAAATTVKADGTPPAKRVKAKAGKATSEGAGSLDDIFASLLPSSSSPSAGSGKGKKTPTKKKSTLH